MVILFKFTRPERKPKAETKMKDLIFVSGATGNVGRELVNNLVKSSIPVIAGVKNTSKAKKLFPAEIVREFDFKNSDTFSAALDRVTKVFLVRPPQMSNPKEFIPILTYLKNQEISQIVFLSLLGADKTKILPHRKIEDLIKKIELPFTFLRPSFFMQNFNTTHLDEIKQASEISVPAGKGKTSFIDIRDIAESAKVVLTHKDHLGKAYDLTGSTALDYFEVSAMFSEVLGKKITYKNPNIFQFIRQNMAKNIPLNFNLVMAAIYTSAKLGLAERIAPDMKNLIQREPIDFKTYVKNYKKYWI